MKDGFLRDIAAFMQENGIRADRIAVQLREGEAACLCLNADARPCQNLYSVAKTFTATAIGLLFDRGLLSLGDTVPKLLGTWCPAAFAPAWNHITVHHLLTHTAGLPGGCLDIDCMDARAFDENYIHEVMGLGLVEEAGGPAHYSDGAFYLLSCIVERTSGLSLDDFLWKEVFRPLGFRDLAWSHCPKGHAMGATGLYTRIEDAVKLGTLYANGGAWQGKRIFSKDWHRLSIAYRYGWDDANENGYGKGGMYGQQLLVLPRHGLSAAWQNCNGGGEKLYDFVLHWQA